MECLAGTSLENSDICLTCGASICVPGEGDVSRCLLPRPSPRSSPTASCLCAPLQAHGGDRTHPPKPLFLCPLVGPCWALLSIDVLSLPETLCPVLVPLRESASSLCPGA